MAKHERYSAYTYSGFPWLGDIPEHWGLLPIKRVSTKIGSGKTPKGGSTIYTDSGVLFIRSQNVYDSGLLLDDVVFISEDIHSSMKGTEVYPDDLLLNITGASIGRTTIAPMN
ncbi:MAG: restriction endonuclease subunit S, partial [Flavobacteriales bacterium]|nr:restriction endonuclease subunit S [Flavobacteriales bacterium]